ncbi:exopolyphosphatase [Corynebacterium sp. CNJ-954]|uniref:acyclic terpene utilization AtuA family protein n=1 Tax=Corynebacterium sp. CNJ-954 TaxID=1904962 RepID=UPI0009617DFB|nr:acyclic terpene utilization AtuA family protein [Corynebacterium sp. CNJ-954]OLT53789.1 exopolyphosphatase [Corynebacterium sp. CNJ-954]
MSDTPPVRIANFSGFYGDRDSAMREMLDGGEVDYLTGDYLAELTMLILAKGMMKDPTLGYAKRFIDHLDTCLDAIAERGVKVVTNAGGLNPSGLADALREKITERDLSLTVAYVDGDDVREPLRPTFPDALCANAYLGAFGIVECLDAGADIVVTGRVTDASVVVGPAAHHFGWGPDDLDQIAGAMAAGHVIECGTQATGGNYSGFNRGILTGADPMPGFPLAEIHADGTSVITKHAGTGGAVTAGTVTAQLLYEVTGARYAGPDAVLRLDHVHLEDLGSDRVRISGATGEAPPPTTKVGVSRLGGFRNEVQVLFSGLDVEDKAELFTRQLDTLEPRPRTVEYRLERTDHPDADNQAAASARLVCVVWDPDQHRIAEWGRGVVGTALASPPGTFFDGAPPKPSMYGTFSPAYVDNDVPAHTAHLADGTTVVVRPPDITAELGTSQTDEPVPDRRADGETRRAPIGLLADARSGDKGGSANIGLWTRTGEAYPWLLETVTVDSVKELLPETAGLEVEVYPLPRLNAVNIVVQDILGQGVAHGARFDPQGKGLGEWLRSRHVEIPENLLKHSNNSKEAS